MIPEKEEEEKGQEWRCNREWLQSSPQRAGAVKRRGDIRKFKCIYIAGHDLFTHFNFPDVSSDMILRSMLMSLHGHSDLQAERSSRASDVSRVLSSSEHYNSSTTDGLSVISPARLGNALVGRIQVSEMTHVLICCGSL